MLNKSLVKNNMYIIKNGILYVDENEDEYDIYYFPSLVASNKDYIIQIARFNNKVYIRIVQYLANKEIYYYRISLYSPEYLFGSKEIPFKLKDKIIKDIKNGWKEAIEAINEEFGKEVINTSLPMPDYSKL